MNPRAETEDDIVLRFVHTADWHLGKRFPRLAESDELRLTRARVEVLDRIFGAADRERAEVVLCAGDLFDSAEPSEEYWRPLLQRLLNTPRERPIVLLPGNHDPHLPDSVWAKSHRFRQGLPTWVHVVDPPMLELPIGDHAVLYGVPCQSTAGANDPTAKIPERAPGDARIRIGLVHGTTFDVKGYQMNFPISQDAVIERGLDYLAIGDTHSFRFVPADRLLPPTIYPGAPEPTSFGESDAGNVAVVMVTRQRQARVRRERVAHWTWEEVRVTTLAELRELRLRSDLRGRVLRLHVEMALPADELEEAERILVELKGDSAQTGRVDVLELDREGLTLDSSTLPALCQELPPVLQRAVERLVEEESKPDRAEVARRALMQLYLLAKKAS